MSVFESNDTNFGVNLIIPNKNNAIPLQLRQNCFEEGTWGLPGGKNKQGETIEETAMREGEEEFGIKIPKSEIEVINIGQTINFRSMLQIGVAVHGYKGTIRNGIPKLCTKIGYFDGQTLPGNLFLGAEGNIRKYFNHQRYALDTNVTPNAIKSNEEMPIELNLIIINEDNKILLTRSISGMTGNGWNLHKGRVRVGETIESAASRITLECLGIIVPEEEIVFDNFFMKTENDQNIIQIGVIVNHRIKEYVFPKKDEEAKYIPLKSFPGAMALLSNPNLTNYGSGLFYPGTKKLTYK